MLGCAGPSWRGARLALGSDYALASEASVTWRVVDCRDGKGRPAVSPPVAEVTVGKQGSKFQLLTHDVGGALVFDQHQKSDGFSVFRALINDVFLEFRLPETLLGVGQMLQGRAGVDRTFDDGSFAVRNVEARTECTLLPVQRRAPLLVAAPPGQASKATAQK